MTPELSAKRLGKMTASMAAVIMGALDTDGLADYVDRLAGERLYGDLGDDSYQSKAMARGNKVENAALDWYEFSQDVSIERGAHIDHPLIPYVAATPDAIIRGRKVIEAKSPLFTTWAKIKRRREVPSTYRWQTRWQLWCCELTECDFVAWHPRPRGIIIPCTVTSEEIERMGERAMLIEARIRKAMEVIGNA